MALALTIRREPFQQILSGKKKIEYRDITEFYESRLQNQTVPFQLRLINGRFAGAPELTVTVEKVKRNQRRGVFELHLGRILSTQNLKGGE